MSGMLFWICAAGVFYIYAGYPLIIRLLACVFPRPAQMGAPTGKCAVIIVAHNEAARLPAKLKSLLADGNARWIEEIVVASDGSTDGTAQRARETGDPRVRVVEFPARRGKPAVLNEVIPTCRAAIVVLTDARQELHPDAIGALLGVLADERVGVVSGELVFRGGGGATEQGVGFYWNYEKGIRRAEARFASVPGATGALYALRRSLFQPIPAATLIDDVAIPMQAIVRGWRCVFAEGAVAYDEPVADPAREAIRKRRTIAGNAQLVRLFPAWLLPWRNPIWFQYVSHKLLRLVSPFLLLGALVSACRLSANPFYAACAAAQLAFYAVAAMGFVFRRAGLRGAWVGVPLMFTALNLTTLAALLDALRGRFDVTWRRGWDETSVS